MKAKRLLFLVMAICLASGVKAQFNDQPEDIYFYLEETEDGKPINNKYVYVFNFDGRKACLLEWKSIADVKQHLRYNPDYYVDKEESSDYDLIYEASSQGYTSKGDKYYAGNVVITSDNIYQFSSDRSILTNKIYRRTSLGGSSITIKISKRVDKSYFKSGRSRTPSGTMYE